MLKHVALDKQRKFYYQKKLAHRDITKEKTISAPGMVVLRDKGSLEGTSAKDPNAHVLPRLLQSEEQLLDLIRSVSRIVLISYYLLGHYIV